ncbi:MAG: DNA transposition protein [Desulfovibrio sp.]|nr:DNA transposition protein [Desulfovibrio sp.]
MINHDTETLREYEHLLPDQARELADIIGIDKTLALVTKLGGTTFPVAHRRNKIGELRYQLLADVVGDAAADKLTARYGGTKLYIPNCKDALRRVRNMVIVREFDARRAQGETGRDIVFDFAVRYRLADRVLWDIVNKTTADEWDAPACGRKTQLQQCRLFG